MISYIQAHEQLQSFFPMYWLSKIKKKVIWKTNLYTNSCTPYPISGLSELTVRSSYSKWMQEMKKRHIKGSITKGEKLREAFLEGNNLYSGGWKIKEMEFHREEKRIMYVNIMVNNNGHKNNIWKAFLYLEKATLGRKKIEDRGQWSRQAWEGVGWRKFWIQWYIGK